MASPARSPLARLDEAREQIHGPGLLRRMSAGHGVEIWIDTLRSSKLRWPATSRASVKGSS
jgi:hypothetical protein